MELLEVTNLPKVKDSTTNVLQPIDRKVTSIRVDRFLWDKFVEKVKRQGLSTCQVLEVFIYGYVQGTPDHPTAILPAINVNLNVQRVVSKPRRNSIDKRLIETEYRGTFESCARCPDRPHFLASHYETPTLCISEYLCKQCFKTARRYNEVKFWKDL